MTEPNRVSTQDHPLTAPGLFWGALGAVMGFALFYVLAMLGLPGPVYHPIERFWSWSSKDSGLGMLYFRQLGWGVVGAAAGAGLGVLLGRFLGRLQNRERGWILLGWTLMAVAVVIVYSGVQAFGR